MNGLITLITTDQMGLVNGFEKASMHRITFRDIDDFKE